MRYFSWTILKVLVTGASGFVGKALCAEAIARGLNARGVARSKINLSDSVEIGDINSSTNWQATLQGCDVVVHLAARVHVIDELAQDPLQAFLEVNLYGTINLAKQAATVGVKRLVYVSSVGVNGLCTKRGVKFLEQDTPNPHNDYAVSKWEAEQALQRIAKETGLEVVIVRPPLIYGANAPGNFAQLIKFVSSHIPIPLPLASVHNKRDFIYVGNLVDALIVCATNSTAAGQTYLVSDGEHVSTPELICNLAKALGKRCLVFPFPIFILRFLAGLLGKSAAIDRLTQSLQIDSSKICRELGWKPPYTMEQGLKVTAEWYLSHQKSKHD
jgi:nucleoside-diphosphate-sugar epimerase